MTYEISFIYRVEATDKKEAFAKMNSFRGRSPYLSLQEREEMNKNVKRVAAEIKELNVTQK